METLDGCPKGIERIVCENCPIKYIPDYIPDEAIMGLTKEEIAKGKANWKIKNKREMTKIAKASKAAVITAKDYSH